MAFGGFERGSAPSQPMAEINVTPLVDVMLVLLVIFIITAPLLARALKVDLPQVDAPAAATNTPTIQLGIDAAGNFNWNGEPLAMDQLATQLDAAARAQPQPELHLSADKAVRYEHVAAALAAAQKAGLEKIGFVTEPPRPTDAGSAAR